MDTSILHFIDKKTLEEAVPDPSPEVPRPLQEPI